MTLPSVIAARIHASGSPDGTKHYIMRYPNGIGPASAISDIYDTEFEGLTNSTGTHSLNRAIRVGGDIYAAGHEGVYKITGDGSAAGTVTLEHSFGAEELATPRSHLTSGLHLIYDGDGIPWLTCIYRINAANSVRGVKMNVNTGVWTETASSVIPNSDGWYPGTAEAVFNGKLYKILNRTNLSELNTLITWDPVSEVFGYITLTGFAGTSGQARGALCAHKGSLYAIAMYGTRYGLYDITTSVSKLYEDATGYSANAGNPVMWSDGTYLWACIETRVRRWDLDSSTTPTDINAIGSAVPAGFNNSIARYRVLYDYETDPINPDIYIYTSADSGIGTSNDLYLFDPSSTPYFKVQGSGGDVLHSMPTRNLGGERFYTNGQPDILVTGVSGTTGGTQISFKCYGGGSGWIAKFYLTLRNYDGAAATQAALVGGVTGGTATRNGDQIEGIDADGSTTYTAIIDPVASGFSIGTAARLIPHIS